MKVITKDQAASFTDRKTTFGTPGIYALVDPRDGTPRYVGSTAHAEHRLYAHMVTCQRMRTPRALWLAELKGQGLWPELWLLEEGDFGPTGSPERHDAEARWIEICQDVFGGADMNSRLVPLGHHNLKNSNTKSMSAEIRALRAKVRELEATLAAAREGHLATRNLGATRPRCRALFGV